MEYLDHNDQRSVLIGELRLSNEHPLVLIAGPCVLESHDHALETARALAEITSKLRIGLIYKSSFDKANRTSIHSERGIGLSKGLVILADVREAVGCPVLTDVHWPEQCAAVAEAVDVLQIPAFLCRQTDLLVAAARTGKPINVKKGQFLAPWDMRWVIEKLASSGNRNILLCERGTCFGYNNLISDLRSLPIMAASGYPVVFDATHSVQEPGGTGSISGGKRIFAPILARAAVAVGVASLFIETHPQPDQAPSDGPNMIPIRSLPELLGELIEFDRLAKSQLRRRQGATRAQS